MVDTRRVTARRADEARDDEEPALDLARKRVAVEGGSLKKALREIRAERRERARSIALAEAPPARQEGDAWIRVSSDPRWPFGIKDDLVIAPYGLSECGTPRINDPKESRKGPLKNSLATRGEARDIIMQKLQRMGCDPIKIMAELAMDEEEKSEIRLRAAAELATMVYPRLRGVESTNREEKTIFVVAVPSEQPKTTDQWLAIAEGPRRIANAVAATDDTTIEGVVVSES